MKEADDLQDLVAAVSSSLHRFSSFAAEDLRLLPPFLDLSSAGFSTTTTSSLSSSSSFSSSAVGSKNGSKLKFSKGNATGAIIFAR